MGDIIDTKQVYQEELNDIRWHKKREKILILCHNKCSICKASTNLHVHHYYYIVGHKAWEYPNNALTVLCGECHHKWHQEHELLVLPKMFNKKNKFVAPIKKCLPRRSKKSNKTKSSTVKLSTRQRQILVKRDRAKRKLIKSYGFIARESVRVFNETKHMTIDELRGYLNNIKG